MVELTQCSLNGCVVVSRPIDNQVKNLPDITNMNIKMWIYRLSRGCSFSCSKSGKSPQHHLKGCVVFYWPVDNRVEILGDKMKVRPNFQKPVNNQFWPRRPRWLPDLAASYWLLRDTVVLMAVNSILNGILDGAATKQWWFLVTVATFSPIDPCLCFGIKQRAVYIEWQCYFSSFSTLLVAYSRKMWENLELFLFWFFCAEKSKKNSPKLKFWFLLHEKKDGFWKICAFSF